MKIENAVASLPRNLENVVFAIFHNRGAMEGAVDDLLSHGYHQESIRTYMSHGGNLLDDKKESRLGEGLLIGSVAGTILGALLCWIIGIKLFIFHSDPYVSEAKSTLASLIASAGIGGMVGGVLGGIIGQIIPEYPVSDFETELKEGYMLVQVHTEPEQAMLVRGMLEYHGGIVISPSEIHLRRFKKHEGKNHARAG